MKTNYLLVDYENVQPQSLQMLNGRRFHVIVFVGANQTKVPLELAASLQALGSAAKYVRISATGRNALDFHIAFELGRLAVEDSKACFYVISKDKGFDPLMTQMRGQGIEAHRFNKVADIPSLGIVDTRTTADKVAAIVRNLQSRGNAKPRRRQTLASTIQSIFQKSLEPAEVDALIEALQQGGHISLDGDAVKYEASRA